MLHISLLNICHYSVFMILLFTFFDFPWLPVRIIPYNSKLLQRGFMERLAFQQRISRVQRRFAGPKTDKIHFLIMLTWRKSQYLVELFCNVACNVSYVEWHFFQFPQINNWPRPLLSIFFPIHLSQSTLPHLLNWESSETNIVDVLFKITGEG